jgi:hypothetical protein
MTGDIRPQAAERAVAEYQKVVPGATLRTRAQIARLLGGLELLDPGLVPVAQWRPDEPPAPGAGTAWILGGIGRKTG